MPPHHLDSQEATLKFIEDYRKLEVLWNSEIIEYNNRDLRLKALNKLAEIYDMDLVGVKNKIKSIRSYYCRERDKMLKATLTGIKYQTCWFAYDYLHFIKDHTSTKSDEDMRKIKWGKETTTNEYFEEPLEVYDEEELENMEQAGEVMVSEFDSLEQDAEETPRTAKKFRSNPLKRPRLDTVYEETQYKNGHVDNPIHYESKEVKRFTTENADECTVFGQYVASKLRRLNSKRIISVAQHRIINYLFKLEMGNANAEL